MKETINYCEFYPKKFVAMNDDDKQLLQDSYCNWLIALEGVEIKRKWNWRVHIYPSTEERTYKINSPLYSSTYFPTFHEANVFAKEMEKLANEAKLTAMIK